MAGIVANWAEVGLLIDEDPEKRTEWAGGGAKPKPRQMADP